MIRYCRLLMLSVVILAGCGGGGNEHRDIGPGRSLPDLSDVVVYSAESPYQGVLKGCVTAITEENAENFCSMATLPLLGQVVDSPTVDDIMGRVLVSHQWMGDRFRQVLEQLPPDVLVLMKGVTAIVIDGDIRPSFYAGDTAAIYLDPQNLWLTNEEKTTISQVADYRDGYGAGLKFETLWRYVSGNDYAYDYYPLDGSATRQLHDILLPMARLLYHELAHANDLLPAARIAGLDRQLTPGTALQELAAENVAAGLEAFHPLISEMWHRLAGVLFFGDKLTADLAGLSAGAVGADFAADVANDSYCYASAHEDVAMLFEETMMKYHYDIDRDIAFTTRPAKNTNYCSDYVVQWGVRNRVGAGTVKERAAFVVEQLLPDEDLTAILGGLPLPTMMTVGRDWCQNLDLTGTPQPQGLPARTGSLPERDRLPPD